jgi:4-azaleucine resistance transporter AzlC
MIFGDLTQESVKTMRTSLVKTAFVKSLPVMAGYIVLGIGFGILLGEAGFGPMWALLFSLFVFAGSMQFVGVSLIAGGASVLVTALTTLMVNARHIFYSVSMYGIYKDAGRKKPALIFTLTDETYSLLCTENPDIAPKERKKYYILVTLFDHIYWVLGTALGSVFGALVTFNSQGIDFVLTALFITIFVEQWLTAKKHASAILGVAISVICLVVFGSQSFLIPSMLIILLSLCLYKEVGEHE